MPLSQPRLDRQRTIYRIEAFPLELDEAALTAWLRTLTGTLQPPVISLGPSPSIVFEAWGDGTGITFRLRVPSKHREHVIGQLHSHLPGLHVREEPAYPPHDWQHAVELKLTHPGRSLDIDSGEALSTTMRTPLQQLGDHERVLMQWVVTPAIRSSPPAVPQARPTRGQRLSGGRYVERDELNERRKKLGEPNLLAALRIGANADTPGRAEQLVATVCQAVASARGAKASFVKRLANPERVKQRCEAASTPYMFPIRLSLSEFAGLLGWKLGKDFVPGVAVTTTRRLPAHPLIPSTGRILGLSNMSGQRRVVAMSYDSAVRHSYVLGATGMGKTTMLANMMAQDMAHGYGVIVIEAKDDLFQLVLERIPDDRLDDVIILDVNDTTHPVGFNIFDQGDNRTAIDELSILIGTMYRDTSQSLTAPQMLYHLTHALAEVPGTTLMDLPVLMRPAPSNTAEWAWRDHIARQVTDPQIAAYVRAFVNADPREQDRQAGPLYNRIWEFVSRPEIRAILGQRTSSFKMRDVIAGNKILLVSLSGARVGTTTASLAGTLLVNAIWQAVRSVRPDKPNFLYLDEFGDFMNLPVDIESILDKSRSANLGMVLAHQRLSQLTPSLRDGVMTNPATKVVFRTSAQNASLIAREFGGYVKDHDFTGLPPYEAIAIVGVDGGIAPPVSIATRPPGESTGNAARVRGLSRSRYGRPIEDVERELTNYGVPERPRRSRPKLSGGD